MYRKKWVLLLVLAASLLTAAGCGRKTQRLSGPQAMQLLLEQLSFATDLTREDGSIYFPDLPAGSSVIRYSGSGYYADELVLMTLNSKADFPAARQAVENHLKELKNQFLNYFPEEVGKIDNAVIYETEQELLLCITDDHIHADSLLARGLPEADGVHSGPAAETSPSVPETTEPHYPVLQSKEGIYHDYENNTIRVDNSAFELYGYSSSSAGTYAGLVNKAAEQLQGQTDVYALAIPTAVGVILPDDIAQILPGFVDQGQVIEKIYAQMNDHVIPVRCFRNLMAHRDEYLYFRTDYHWNGRGAYYAYESFCQTKGIDPIPLSERTKKEFGDFLGVLYTRFSGEDPALKDTPDTVEAFCPKSASAAMSFTDLNGETHDWNIIMDVSDWDSESKYSTFAGSDSPFATFTNPEIKDDSVCVVVKESYGNALLPYLVDHYHTIYEIDYRYWQGDLVEFTKQKQADDLIFANNLTMISTDLLVGYLADIF